MLIVKSAQARLSCRSRIRFWWEGERAGSSAYWERGRGFRQRHNRSEAGFAGQRLQLEPVMVELPAVLLGHCAFLRVVLGVDSGGLLVVAERSFAQRANCRGGHRIRHITRGVFAGMVEAKVQSRKDGKATLSTTHREMSRLRFYVARRLQDPARSDCSSTELR